MAKTRGDSIPGPLLIVIGLGVVLISIYFISVNDSKLQLFIVAGGIVALYGIAKTLFSGRKKKAHKEIISDAKKTQPAHTVHKTYQKHQSHQANQVHPANQTHQPQPQHQSHQSPKVYYCPNCGQPLHPDNNYCPGCGQRLR